MIKVGLIGLGNMGRNHLRILSLLKNIELTFIYDANLETAKRLADEYQVRHVEIPALHYGEVDAVVIAAPTKFHFQYINEVAGKVPNIFIEKPMTATLEEAKDVLTLQEKHGFNLMVGLIERFNPAIQELAKLVHQAKAINIDFIRTNKLSARIQDVDVVSDLMIHDIDLALYLNGAVKEVQAQGFVENGMIGYANATLIHENGAFSRIQASRLTEKKTRSVQATCVDMFIDCDLLRKEIIISRQSEVREGQNQVYTIQSVQENVAVKLEEALQSELKAFIQSCNQAETMNAMLPKTAAGYQSVVLCSQIQNLILHGK